MTGKGAALRGEAPWLINLGTGPRLAHHRLRLCDGGNDGVGEERGGEKPIGDGGMVFGEGGGGWVGSLYKIKDDGDMLGYLNQVIVTVHDKYQRELNQRTRRTSIYPRGPVPPQHHL